MKSAIAELVGESPYSQSKHYEKEDVPELKGETHHAYEIRTWRNRMHVTDDGFVEMPGMGFANSIKYAAGRMSLKIKGGGMKTYTKNFESGIMVPGNVKLDIKAADVPFDKLFVPSDGKRGGGSRVTKFFPRIDAWKAAVTFFTFDDVITDDIFARVLVYAGQLVGVGRFRPQNLGFYGRFSVKSLRWMEEDETVAAIAK